MQANYSLTQENSNRSICRNYGGRPLTFHETNALLSAACANQSLAIMQEKTDVFTGELWNQPLPLRVGAHSDVQATEGLRLWVNNSAYSKDMSREDKLANGCYCVVLEYDTDADGMPVPLEQQIAWVKEAKVPVSYAFWTGGKSIHFWVLLSREGQVHDSTWRALANGMMQKLNKVSNSKATVDPGAVVAMHSWRFPCSVHEKTKEQGLLLANISSMRSYKLHELGHYYCPVETNKRSSSGKSYEGCDTVEKLEQELAKYLGLFRRISEKGFAVVETQAIKELALVRRGRGKGAGTDVWAIANRYASIVTGYKTAAECVHWFMDTLKPTLDAQDDERGKPWDTVEIQRAIVRGLSSGLQWRYDSGTNTEREFTGKQMQAPYVSDILEQIGKQEKLVFIRSNTGTGKTQAIKRRLAELPEGARVLFLCHRTALVDQWLAADNTITDYRKLKDNRDLSSVSRLAVCVDSLRKLATMARTKRANVQYDLVVLDECDQLAQHMLLSLGTDVKDSRLLTLKILRAIIYKSTQTIAASAHLSNLEVDIIRQLAKGDSEQEVNAIAIVNTTKPQSRKYEFLSSEEQAFGKVKQMLDAGERVFICCDSKDKAHAIYSDLQQNYRDKMGKVISSETIAANSAAMRVLSDFVSQLDYLVASPSLGTGYDINNSHFHSVVGIFTNTRDLGFHDLEQALARVRYPIGDVSYVFVSPLSNHQPTEIEYLKSLWRVGEAALETEASVITDFSLEGKITVDSMGEQIADWQGLYIVRKVTETMQREAKLMSVLRERGHEVTKAECERKEKIDTSFYKSQKALAILEAAQVTEQEYRQLLDNYYRDRSLTQEEQAQVTRHRVQLFFGNCQLEISDVAWWLKNGVRVQKYQELLQMTEEQAIAVDTMESKRTGVNGGYGARFCHKNREVALTLAEHIETLAQLKHYTKSSPEVQAFAEWAANNCPALKQLEVTYSKSNPCQMIASAAELEFISQARKSVKVNGRDTKANKLVRTADDQARYECWLDATEAPEVELELEGIY